MGLRAFSEPGDEVLLFSPIYYSFFNTIKNNGRVAREIPLRIVKDQYEVDFNELEKRLSGKEKIIIFCSPHNPGGKIWNIETLTTLAAVSYTHLRAHETTSHLVCRLLLLELLLEKWCAVYLSMSNHDGSHP